MRRRGGVRMLGRWWRGRSRADRLQHIVVVLDMMVCGVTGGWVLDSFTTMEHYEWIMTCT